MHASYPTRRGFTLVEILAVVVIIGIAAAVVVPQISSRDDLKASAAARVVMADLMYAQNSAITLQKKHYVVFDVAARKYSLLADPGLVLLTHPINKTSYVANFGASGSSAMKDTTLASATFRGQSSGDQLSLAFDELGTPLAYSAIDGSTDSLADGKIVLQCGQNRLQINVEPYTGQLSVQEIP